MRWNPRFILVVLAVSLVVVSSYCFRGCQGWCHEEERSALIQIRNDHYYPNASAFTSWEGKDCCSWDGIHYNNSTNRVIEIVLKGLAFDYESEVGGRWYPNVTLFAQFRELETLDLSFAHIGGWVMPQAFCQLKNLKKLDLGYNFIGGSVHPCICSMPSLAYLDLSYNLFKENFPLCLCNSSSLTDLDLSGNDFQGNLPPCLDDMHFLRSLNLYKNKFQGNIPSSLCSIHSLRNLDLSDNQFQGTIPPCFSNLTMIEYIDFSGNNFEGILSFSMFANLSKLQYIFLQSNRQLEIEIESPTWNPTFQLSILAIQSCIINKRSGYRFPSFISTQYNLLFLVLSNTNLSGSIPFWLLNNSSLPYLILPENMFSGQFPQPYHNTSSSLWYLDISNNLLTGSLPTNIGTLFPYLSTVYMSGNDFQGCIPPSFGELRYLERLFLKENNLSCEIPQSLTKNGTTLEFLVLSNNKLSGGMLPKDLNMPNLKYLFLHDNHFSGSIPPSLANISSLLVLDIGNNYLTGNLSSSLPILSNMSAILMRGNRFSGHVPSQLCQMQHLQFLDLSNNSLSGKIPPCLTNISFWKSKSNDARSLMRELSDRSMNLHPRYWIMELEDVAIQFTTKNILNFYEGAPITQMIGIDISSNRLDGVIPYEMGGLTQLRALNLSNNLLQGHFPTSFVELESIESLDLSHNMLNGPIPPDIVQLHFISTFNVAFNDLSGKIPFEGQFSSFNETSYEGNTNLCGQPIIRNCSSNVPGQSPQVEAREEKEQGIVDNVVFYYSFVAISFGLGFWGVIFFFFFNRKWRIKFFSVTDPYSDLFVEKILELLESLKNQF